MNTQQSFSSDITPQQVTSIISGLIALTSALFTSYMAMRQKKKEKDGQVEISDREQNRELVKNLQDSDKYKQAKIDEMETKISDLYETCQNLVKENSDFKARLVNYELQKDAWQRERDTWQSEREIWQVERRQHEQEKKLWEKEREAWHVERRELVTQIRNLEAQIQDLEQKFNRRY
jgi:chromosome segregation ATPase